MSEASERAFRIENDKNPKATAKGGFFEKADFDENPFTQEAKKKASEKADRDRKNKVTREDIELKDSNNEKLALLNPKQADAIRAEANTLRAAQRETDNDSNYQYALADLLKPNSNNPYVVRFRKDIGL